MTAWSRHLIHWYENVSSLQSQPSVDALLCELNWKFKQHDTHTHKSTSNISLTAQMKWDHNLPKKKWKDRQVLFIGILIVKGQLHIRQFETLFWWHRLWCLGVCWRKWMHFSQNVSCFASCSWSCNQHLWLLCAFEWKQIQLASRINYTRVINIAMIIYSL